MKFFSTLHGLSTWKCTYDDPFLVQYEIVEPKDDRTRMYIVFDGVDEYKKRMNYYNTCHECFINSDGWNKEDDVQGHPAFDIDAEIGTLSIDWRDTFIRDLTSVLITMFPSKKDDIISHLIPSNIVWMRSLTDEKVSYHLVMNGITFSKWRWASTIMYRLLREKGHTYIDDGIVRVAGSLRMVFNYKVKDKERVKAIIFEDDHQFEESLVLIHEANIHTVGTFLMSDDVDRSLLTIRDMIGGSSTHTIDEDIDDDLISLAFSNIDRQYDTGLTIGSTQNGYISLDRVRPGTCPISMRAHDRVGAYIFTKTIDDEVRVYFGCHRRCTTKYGGYDKYSIDITPHHPISHSSIIASSCPDIDE